jgi:hypothetical protein
MMDDSSRPAPSTDPKEVTTGPVPGRGLPTAMATLNADAEPPTIFGLSKGYRGAAARAEDHELTPGARAAAIRNYNASELTASAWAVVAIATQVW